MLLLPAAFYGSNFEVSEESPQRFLNIYLDLQTQGKTTAKLPTLFDTQFSLSCSLTRSHLCLLVIIFHLDNVIKKQCKATIRTVLRL